MRDSDGGINLEEQNRSASPDPSQETAASHFSSAEAQDFSPSHIPETASEQNEGEEAAQGDPKSLRTHGSLEHSAESQPANPKSLPNNPVKDGSESPLREAQCLSSVVSPELDPEGDLTFEEDGRGENFHCQYCELQFATKHDLEHHIQTHSVTANVFKCKYCSKPFGSQVGKRRHERRHENGSKLLKRPGLLAGTALLFNSSRPNDSPTSPSTTVMSPNNGPVQPSTYASTTDPPFEPDHPLLVDENGESKELHPCKYCNKAFGSHTNMRRHQRRIHERHLMPKGVRRKGMLLQDTLSQQQEAGQAAVLQKASPNTSPPLIYVPSVDTDDEGERDDSMVDVSRNISENLSLYIDGKILATSAVSSCDVIEVDSSAPALFGLDAVILNPNQLSQALKIETQPCPVKELSVTAQAGLKRRTATPPLLPAVKMESETSTSTSSSQSPSLGGTIFSQTAETLNFQKEKSIYLSPKLKQLLQTQESKKPTDSCRLTTPLSIASLPAAQGRFKRRTASPPAPVQSSSPVSSDSSGVETANSLSIKVESHCVNYSWSTSSKDERDSISPSAKDWPALISGGSSCNQQPLDLSSAVAKGDCGSSTGLGESVLDLSLQHKNAADPKAKSRGSLQPHAKRKKPNTSMLEKVLMNEYSGLSSAGEDGSVCLGSPDAHLSPASVCSNSEPPPFESASPPSLTPVTMNPPSPSSSSQTSSTPPPPVLPSVPSPPTLAQFSDFPSLSPKPVDPTLDDTSGSSDATGPYHDNTDLNQTATVDALPSSPEDITSRCTADPVSDTLLTDSESDLNLLSHVSSYERNCDSQSSQSSSRDESLPQNVSIKTELQSCHSPVHLTTNLESLSGPSQSPVVDGADSGALGNKPVSDGISLSTRVPLMASDGASVSEQDTFSKSFVCNVCEEPFHSIKQLSSHITDHAGDWPFKCEFCVQLFQNSDALLEHRSSLHGVGRIYICPACSKEFAFLCNLQQHQSDLHPGQSLAHTTVENGKLRPQNYTDPTQVNVERMASNSSPNTTAADVPSEDLSRLCNGSEIKKEDDAEEREDPTEELYTTIKIMASEAGKPKCPDVRLGINQHYPSFKPPPFPYHNRTTAGSVASATNFTTHNIPQTFSTAIRCTKCGNSFDNMPELHKHILACANASDKRRYTPKKNPIPLKQIIKQPHNGVVSPTAAAGGGQNAFRRMGQPKRLNFNQEVPSKMMSALNKKKNQLIQKAISQKNKAATSLKKVQVKQEDPGMHACPYCGREFIYPASLAKHVTCSCPQKPVAKKKEALATQDKNMKLRSRAADSEIKPEINLGPPLKALGKTRARSSERESETTAAGKGKMLTSQIRAKRPAHGKDPSAPKSKKGRKSKTLPAVPSSPATRANDSASQQAGKVLGKDAAIKKEAETKPEVQSKKEERFSKRVRDRVGGPMTRSLQMASGTSPAEVKSEDLPNSETTPGELKESC